MTMNSLQESTHGSHTRDTITFSLQSKRLGSDGEITQVGASSTRLTTRP